jgi:autotransporter-associated beta strand protein
VNASFSVTGGSFAADHFTLLAAGSANTATMTIGGTAEVMLPAFPIGRGPDSTATLYFDGGILKPLAADTAYLGGLTHAFIKTGGATFDTTYGSITISQALLTDAVATGGGLTKNGSNTVTLIGANTYSGDTTVNGGTLSLGTINIDNELSTITIAASDALLQLNFTGTDTVTKLFIGTAQQPAGQYGHSSTGATNGGLGVAAMDAFFAPGPGTLTVTGSPPLDGYAAWKTDHAPVGGANDDFDTDGVPNGIEYVLGGTKDTADGDKLPTLSASGGNIVFAFVRDQASIDGSTTLVIEVGTTPGLWADSHPVPDGPAAANPGVTVAKDHPAAGRDTVMLSLPMDEATRRFARLKVTVR